MDKKIVALVALAGLTLGGTLAYGEATAKPGEGIVKSKHDMNVLPEANVVGSELTLDSQGRVCAFCHTPHHKLTDASLNYNPLWSHEISKDSGWTAYKSVTFDAQSKLNTDPLVGPSRLCMSCHDGIIAVDQHYGNTGQLKNGDRLHEDGFLQIAVGKGKDLSNDHPIGFELSGINALDPGIRANLKGGVFNGKPIETLGFNDGTKTWMTCASCHDVHNRDTADVAFLYAPQAGSAFCIMCHDK